ncbi:nucleotidyltransferase domain-containing protein [bacterium]|nr:nucleotidyltransferase domain-containing protein [bacterium]
MEIIKSHLENNEVWLHGSRSGDSPKPHSDVDLVIIDPPLVSQKTLSLLKLDFEDSNLPFRVDISLWSELTESFQEIIKDKHEIFYLPPKE